ncbi:hypothetical protein CAUPRSCDRAFT_13057, partial [Caulochytrium protostelioides]
MSVPATATATPPASSYRHGSWLPASKAANGGPPPSASADAHAEVTKKDRKRMSINHRRSAYGAGMLAPSNRNSMMMDQSQQPPHFDVNSDAQPEPFEDQSSELYGEPSAVLQQQQQQQQQQLQYQQQYRQQQSYPVQQQQQQPGGH